MSPKQTSFLIFLLAVLCFSNAYSETEVSTALPLDALKFAIVPFSEAPSSSAELSFDNYRHFFSVVSDTAYTAKDLATDFHLSSANYKKGISLFFMAPDGGYDFSKWPSAAHVRILYVLNGDDVKIRKLKSHQDSSVAADSDISEIDFNLPSVQSSLKRGRLDINTQDIPGLKNGQFVTFMILAGDTARFTAVKHHEGASFFSAFPSLLRTNLTAISTGKSTALFEVIPTFTWTPGFLVDTSTVNGWGLVGVFSVDALWLLSRVGSQVAGPDFRPLVQSVLLGGAFLLKRDNNVLYFGLGGNLEFVNESFNPQLSVIVGAHVLELLSNFLNPPPK